MAPATLVRKGSVVPGAGAVSGGGATVGHGTTSAREAAPPAATTSCAVGLTAPGGRSTSIQKSVAGNSALRDLRVKAEFLDGLGAPVGAVPFAEKANGNLVDFAGIRHEVSVLDVALLQSPEDLGDVIVGFQAADIDPEALGDLPSRPPRLPR